MDKCKRCGADLPANAKFCTSCGEKTGTEIPNVSTQNVPGAENIQGSPYPPYAEAVPSSPAPAYTAYREPPKKKRWWIPLVIILVVLAILAGVWFAFGNSIKSLFLSDN
ncbi:MAG: zinc-ribbon domain-containing protein, partial [Clostridiaceae bacterium]|nr:zinc-ribbon domain-containing protein [Clostridiaceae bacterium]